MKNALEEHEENIANNIESDYQKIYILLPLPTVITALEESLDRTSCEARYLRFGRFTYDREEAVGENGVRLLRPGNPYLDAVERLVRHDDRGAAFALWRHRPSLPEGEADLFFRTDSSSRPT